MGIDLGADTIVIVRPAGLDWQGDPTGDPAETTVTGCMIEPAGSASQAASQENSAGGDTVITGAQAWLPAGTDIRATDRVRLADGNVYAVDGRPSRWHDDTGTEDHVQAQLRLTEGT